MILSEIFQDVIYHCQRLVFPENKKTKTFYWSLINSFPRNYSNRRFSISQSSLWENYTIRAGFKLISVSNIR